MTVNVIPFNMPEPMEIPSHIVDHLRALPEDEAMRTALELLMQVQAADTILYERVDEEGRLQLAEVIGPEGPQPELKERLETASFYGKPVDADASGLAGRALTQEQSLLVMGQIEAGDAGPLPEGLAELAVGETGGNVGFIYVLRLAHGGQARGALTLVRAATEGPMNHDQPNIAEGIRRLLAERLCA